MATAAELGPGGTDEYGKPIFIATEHTRYAPSTERELSDQEQLAWKSFQLWRATMSVERRDNVYRSITNSDYTNFRIAYHMMGTPFPVIDFQPGFIDAIKGVRWYEHATAFAAGYGYAYWIKSKASTRFAKMIPASRSSITFITICCTELCFCYRSMWRLSGYLSNDYECRKYGVLEDKQRLQRKKELWEKYAAYKKEWCRRWDYHVYGMRPGETFSPFSACMIPMWTPKFSQCVDYPMRKNPYFLTATPLRDMFMEYSLANEVPNDDSVPLIQARPEMKYIYRGPEPKAGKK